MADFYMWCMFDEQHVQPKEHAAIEWIVNSMTPRTFMALTEELTKRTPLSALAVKRANKEDSNSLPVICKNCFIDACSVIAQNERKE